MSVLVAVHRAELSPGKLSLRMSVLERYPLVKYAINVSNCAIYTRVFKISVKTRQKSRFQTLASDTRRLRNVRGHR